ncbi:cAMP biosynthetic process [Homalodisca vitripennis]|nr:cAMP biosynthetic process [Homalodisca vitripennis]
MVVYKLLTGIFDYSLRGSICECLLVSIHRNQSHQNALFSKNFVMNRIQRVSGEGSKDMDFFNTKETKFNVSAGMSVVMLVVFVLSQLPWVLRDERAALVVSVIAVALLGSGVLSLAGPSVPLPLFALVVATHTVLPVPQHVSVLLAAILTLSQLTLTSWRATSGLGDPRFYTEVSHLTHIV